MAMSFCTKHTRRGLPIISIKLNFSNSDPGSVASEESWGCWHHLFSAGDPEICTNKMLIGVLVENFTKENQVLLNWCDSFY